MGKVLSRLDILLHANTANYRRDIKQASGVLRGDEFNSVAEQAPVLLDLFAKELDKTRGALRKLAADGALTSDVIYNAISSVTDVLDEKMSKVTVTFTQAVGVFKDQYAIL